MEKQHQNSEQPTGGTEPEVPRRENEPIIEGATKKCPHCGEDLPAKIAFCLYCMNPLIGDTAQKTETKPQGNVGNRFQKKSAKLLIGAAAILIVIAIVATTPLSYSFITSRQGNDPHNQPAITEPTMPPGTSVGSTFNLEPSPTPQPSPQPTTSPSVSGQGNRPSNPTISLERAIEIAYADIAAQGINASFRSDSGMSWEREQWVWELLFSTQGERMPLIEFYINVDDGRIVKFEWDD